MKNTERATYLGALVLASLLISYVFTQSFVNKENFDDPYPYPVEHWQKLGTNAATRIDYKRIRQVYIRVTPTVANGGTIDISGLGMTNIMGKQISAQRNNTNAYDVPQASFKSVSTSSISYNIVQGSNTLVSVLGLNVLQGPSTIFATDLSNIEINITITGY